MPRRGSNGKPLLPQMPDDATSEKAGSSEDSDDAVVHGNPPHFSRGYGMIADTARSIYDQAIGPRLSRNRCQRLLLTKLRRRFRNYPAANGVIYLRTAIEGEYDVT